MQVDRERPGCAWNTGQDGILRARTKTANSCWTDDAGKRDALCGVRVAQPSSPVVAPADVELLERNGRRIDERTRDRAAPTRRDVKRSVRSFVERVTVVGDAAWPSTRSRAGSDTPEMFVGPVPAGHPVGAGAGGAVTTAEGADSACAEPSPFFAVTRTRTVFPRSAFLSVYVDLLPPLMLEQLPPFWPQRRHW